MEKSRNLSSMYIYNYNNNNNTNGFHLYNTMFQVLAPGTFTFSAHAPPWGSNYPIPSWGNQKVKWFSTASKWQRCGKPTMCPALCSAPTTRKSILKATMPSAGHEEWPNQPSARVTNHPFCQGQRGFLECRVFNAKSIRVLSKLEWVSHLPRVSEHCWLSPPVHVGVCMCVYMCVLIYSWVPEWGTSLPCQAQQFSARVKVL